MNDLLSTPARMLVAISLLAFVLPPVHAVGVDNAMCLPDASLGNPSTGTTEISLDPAHTLYVDDRSYLGDGTYVYEETNGVFLGGDVCADLQWGGCSPYVPYDCDPCSREVGPYCGPAPDQLLI